MGTSRTGGLQRLKPGGNKEAKTDGHKGSKPGYRKKAPKVYDGKKKPTFLDLQKTKKKEKKEKRNV